MRSNFKGNASRSYGLLLFSTFLGILYNVKSYSSKIIRKCLNKNIDIGIVYISTCLLFELNSNELLYFNHLALSASILILYISSPFSLNIFLMKILS